MPTKTETIHRASRWATSIQGEANEAYLDVNGLTQEQYKQQLAPIALAAHNAIVAIADNPHADWYVGHHAKYVQKNLEGLGFKPLPVDDAVMRLASGRFREHFSNDDTIAEKYGGWNDSVELSWKIPRRKQATAGV